jgi:hypothetical protein
MSTFGLFWELFSPHSIASLFPININDGDEAPQYAKDAIWNGLVSETACEAEIRKKERTTDLVIQAVKSGFRGIDTACQPKVRLSDLIKLDVWLVSTTGRI